MSESHFRPRSSPAPIPPPRLAAGPVSRFSFLSSALVFMFPLNCCGLGRSGHRLLRTRSNSRGRKGDSVNNRTLSESVYSGNATAKDKIAIIQGGRRYHGGCCIRYPHKQIEQAVEDDHVKAVVLRIDTSGGSITASDELYRCLVDLRDGTTPDKKAKPKPVIVSMGALAASGGYYIAASAQTILAERTTMTGSTRRLRRASHDQRAGEKIRSGHDYHQARRDQGQRFAIQGA